MSFHETKSPEHICQYYLNVLDFLSFVNYNKNITFNNVILSKSHLDKGNRYERIAQAIIFTNATDYDKDNFNSVVFEDIPKDKIGAVFKKAATLRENDHRFYYYPNNTEESRYIDNNRWLMTALCFEGLFQSTYPNYKSNKDENFETVKQGIIAAINNYAESTVLSKKQNKYYNDFKNHIERYEGVLEGKFNFTLKEYKEAISDIIKLIQEKYGVTEKTNYGNLYQSYRNKLAHGDIEIMGNNEIAVYKLLCPMIYILLLKDTGLNISELKKIINKLFNK